MKEYPTIPKVATKESVYVFDKLDGSNIRAEWTPKKGFTKFGRRHGLLDDSNPTLKEAPDLFMARYGDELSRRFKDERYELATAFMEFYGPNSFAGNHEVEPHEVLVFDIHVFKEGILSPKDFLDVCAGLPTPNLLHHGVVTADVVEAIRNSTMPGMTFEGGVAKGSFSQKCGGPTMFKLKSQAWFDRLRQHCKGDEKLFELLS